MSNDYVRELASSLKEAGVESITPEQLEDLAFYLDVENVCNNVREHDV